MERKQARQRGGRKGGKGDDGRWRQGKNQENGKGKDDGRWRQEWNNAMVVLTDWHDDAKHWRRVGTCRPLAALRGLHGSFIRVSEIAHHQKHLDIALRGRCGSDAGWVVDEALQAMMKGCYGIHIHRVSLRHSEGQRTSLPSWSMRRTSPRGQHSFTSSC